MRSSRVSNHKFMQGRADVIVAGYSHTLIFTVRLLPQLPIFGLTECSYLVESDYTVVFFAAGSKYTPGWNWMWKAYRSLSRKYRKNLKRLVCKPPLSLDVTLTSLRIFSILCILTFSQKVSFCLCVERFALNVKSALFPRRGFH
jgi:Divergent CRAL/TRIO domain